jgi:pimeloyl-ACP methyl ester carboxylesterase
MNLSSRARRIAAAFLCAFGGWGCEEADQDQDPPDPEAQVEPEEPGAPPTVVLVHGAWHGPAQWSDLGAELDARGVRWITVDLPSAGPELGSRLNPDGQEVATIPLRSTDVATVVEAVDAIGGPVVLVGHSYGGFVISDAGHHPAVEHLVYLCAFAPETGETLVDLAIGNPLPLIVQALRSSPDGLLLSIDPALATEVFYADLPPDRAAQMVDALVPSIALTFDEPAGVPAWKTVPSTYVGCSRDNAIPQSRQTEMAARLDESVILDSSHSPFLSRPGEVADILAGVVAQPSGAQ